MPSHPLYQVDAFTDQPFAGNPAAVVLLDEMPDNEWLQHVAAEMNLSETAFAAPLGERARYKLRWFTPVAEVDLCGHATLATSHVLWEFGALADTEAVTFETASGTLGAARDGDRIVLDFPAEPAEEIDDIMGLSKALGPRPVFVGSSRLDFLVELEDEAAVRGLEPDMHAIEQIGMRGVIVTARGHGDSYDFVSRYFAPRFGIPEDPVTGSAHCVLAPYWSAKLGRNALVGYQASARGGTVGVELAGNRVKLRGQAVTMFSGTLLV